MLAVPLLHPIDTHFIEWFEDIEGCKEESARAASGVEDRHLAQLSIEMLHKQVVVSLCQQVLHKLTNIEIVGNEVVDFCNLAILNLCLDVSITL